MRIYPILILLLLVGALLLVGKAPISAQTSTATFTPLPVNTVTPTQPSVIIIATAPPHATAIPRQANGCYAPLTLTVGGDVLLRGGINVRSAPSLSAPLMNYYPSQVVLHLDGGPTCANGYNWWQISGVGLGGWVIEGTPAQYFLKPYANPATTNCAAPLDTIQVGGQLRAVTGSRVRQSPNNNATVVTVVQPGMVIPVTGGPTCFEGLNWWQVRAPYGATNIPVDGWLAEGFPGGYFVEGLTASAQAVPVQQCLNALRLHNGTRAAVTYKDGIPRRLRAEPSTSAAVVAELVDGVAFDVISDGATCADGYNWWQVHVLETGLTGWLAEGAPGNYWFEILVN